MAAPTRPETRAPRGEAVDGGRLLAGLGALALLISLFLDWWGPSGSFGSEGADAGITAWNVFELVDILLAALALFTLALAVEAVMRPARAWLPSTLGTAAGPVALVLIVVSLVNEPPLLTLSAGTDLEAGAWLALGGALVMTIGSLLRYARVSISVTPRERAPDPETETRPFDETETRPFGEEPRRGPR